MISWMKHVLMILVVVMLLMLKLIMPTHDIGAAMNVASNEQELEGYLTQAVKLSTDFPVVISKFIVNAKEIEYDGVAKVNIEMGGVLMDMR